MQRYLNYRDNTNYFLFHAFSILRMASRLASSFGIKLVSVSAMTAESIFFPTLDGDSTPTLTFTLTESENVTKNYSTTVTLPAAGLQAGYAYSLNVKIGATEVELSSIQTIGLTGWGTPDGDYDHNIKQ